MPKPTTSLNVAIRRAQRHPRRLLLDVHRNTLNAAARRGLATPTPSGDGWQLTPAGEDYRPTQP